MEARITVFILLLCGVPVAFLNAQIDPGEFSIAGSIADHGAVTAAGRGRLQYAWNTGYLPGGVYFYRLDTGEFSATRKMFLVK